RDGGRDLREGDRRALPRRRGGGEGRAAVARVGDRDGAGAGEAGQLVRCGQGRGGGGFGGLGEELCIARRVVRRKASRRGIEPGRSIGGAVARSDGDRFAIELGGGGRAGGTVGELGRDRA